MLKDSAESAIGKVELPQPYATRSVANFCAVIGWPKDKMPVAPDGFTVTRFADSLDNPRWIYVGPNGDIFVSEAKTGGRGESPNKILLFRDKDHDGKAEYAAVFLQGLQQPFGMVIIGKYFYVANTNGVVRYPYTTGETKITGQGEKITDLPAGGYNNHWTRNIVTNKDGSKLYVSVGSGSNAGEHGMDHEKRRADILEINPDGSGETIYASGLRNPQGMGWAPGTNVLWTSVNERDELGDSLVPDFLTGLKRGNFYGWPYYYFGNHPDPRIKDPVASETGRDVAVPDVALGAHTASLGLAFDERQQLPGAYRGAAFIGQHGSWNSSQLVGYEVAYVPFKDGKPSGPRKPFLTGFIADSSGKKVYGRPVGVAFTGDGTLLVADDAGNTIWAVRRRQ